MEDSELQETLERARHYFKLCKKPKLNKEEFRDGK